MMVFYNKQKPKIIQYRKYKIFPMKLLCMNQKVLYRVFLKFHLEHLKALLITYFKNRANQAFFINSKIHMEIMRRNKLN